MKSIPKVLHQEDATPSNSGRYARRINKLVICEQCGVEFQARNQGSKHHNLECYAKSLRKITDADMEEIIKLYNQGWTCKRLGELFKVHPHTVNSNIHKYWREQKNET